MRHYFSPTFLVASSVLAGCSPELGDTPFACSTSSSCPDGYRCEATVCVRDGVTTPAGRPMRVVWINAGEMYWLDSPGGGATLVVNDGFTPGRQGLYEIQVSPDGRIEPPVQLRAFGDEFPTASAVIALDRERYAVATLAFPNVDGQELRLDVFSVERELGSAPGTVETLITENRPYLGGSEPAYIGMIGGREGLDVAFTNPSQGGSVELLRLERNGSIWEVTRSLRYPLPSDVLPLSGDCLLWEQEDDAMGLRIGFNGYAVTRIAQDGAADAFLPVDGVPLRLWGDDLLVLRYDDEDEDGYDVSFVQQTIDGDERGADEGFRAPFDLEPHTAVPYAGGGLVAPIQTDLAAGAFHVGWFAPGQPMRRVATVPRESTEEIYSARAFVKDGQVYVAWTQFHDALMDLWIAVVPGEALP